MSPIFKCLICRRDIERSTKTFWIKGAFAMFNLLGY